MFHVGQMVVCVDAGPWRIRFLPLDTWFPIKKGDVVTIASLPEEDPDCVRIEEHPKCTHHDGLFHKSRFRPVRKTDISIFTAMLNPAPTRVDA